MQLERFEPFAWQPVDPRSQLGRAHPNYAGSVDIFITAHDQKGTLWKGTLRIFVYRNGKVKFTTGPEISDGKQLSLFQMKELAATAPAQEILRKSCREKYKVEILAR